jgi:hypothetical protein
MMLFEHVLAAIGLGAVALLLAVFVWLFRHAKELTPVFRRVALALEAEAKRLQTEKQEKSNDP